MPGPQALRALGPQPAPDVAICRHERPRNQQRYVNLTTHCWHERWYSTEVVEVRLMRLCNRLALLGAVLLPLMAGAQAAPFSDEQSQHALAAGEVAVHAAADDGQHGGRISAAVVIHARPETVWQIMHDCENAPSYIPGLRRCHRIDRASDGSWEIIEREMKYSWLMPPIHSVLFLEYHLPLQMNFRCLSGDLKIEEGSWRVQRTANDAATLVQYELRVDPGFWVPSPIIRASLRHALPEALLALRKRAESLEVRRMALTGEPSR
jgi:hypothetical protein